MIEYKINGINIQELNYFLLSLEFHYNKNNIDIFSITENTSQRKLLWLIYGLKYIIQYVFMSREQPAKIEDIFEFKIRQFYENKNTLQKDEKIINAFINTLNLDKYKALKNFLTENNEIDVNDILKKYPILYEQNKIREELKKNKININSLENLKKIYNKPRRTQTDEINIKNFINKKGFLLFYQEDKTNDLKDFFIWHNEIIRILSNTEINIILNTLSECVLLFDEKELEEIIKKIETTHPSPSIANNILAKNNIDKGKEELQKNFINFLKNPEKVSEERVKKIFNGIKGYTNINKNFFNVKFEINNIKDKDFEKLLKLVDFTIEAINEELKNKITANINEIDFWNDETKISLYFKFIYLSLNIYFNYIFDKLKIK
jgi:hypothetical protein